MRTVNVEPPDESGLHEGLSYALFLPEGEPAGSLVILHGAGSSKESHFDFARRARLAGIAAACFDQRGHGESEGALDRRCVDDIGEIASLLISRLAVPVLYYMANAGREAPNPMAPGDASPAD